MAAAARIFETASHQGYGPVWSAILSGFAAVDWWGNLYLTKAGEAYLESRREG